MNKAVKGILILYCLGIIGVCIYVPWKGKKEIPAQYVWTGRLNQLLAPKYRKSSDKIVITSPARIVTVKGGYSFIWSPYKKLIDWDWDYSRKESIPVWRSYDNIDFSRILLEIIALTGVTGALVLIFWKKKRKEEK